MTWVGNLTASVRKRLEVVDRVFGPVEYHSPILPRQSHGGFSESTVPACRRLGYCLPDEEHCVYHQEEGA